MSDSNKSQKSVWLDYRSVWRWHFYASLFCMPLVIFLSITGAIYLFRPQIEAWQDRELNQLELTGNRASVAAQVQAAMDSIPGSIVSGYELPPTPAGAPRVLVQSQGQTYRIYMHPENLQVLRTDQEQATLIRQVRSLHGQLGLGVRGSNLVELAASWTIIMLVTGMYLWWPRAAKGLGGVLYPRWRKGMQVFLRDFHSVTGFWISSLALFLLVTGLPWAKFWGSYFRQIRDWSGTAAVAQDWTLGGERIAEKQKSPATDEHAAHRGASPSSGRFGRSKPVMPDDLTAFDRVLATIQPLKLAHPVIINPPTANSSAWTAKSDAQNRTLRTTLTLNGATGEIISREDFADRHWVDRLVGMGIAAHEGQLFGWLNQLLGLVATLGLVVLSLSGYLMWWRRRDPGTLGAPPPLASRRRSFALVAVVLLLAVYLPLFGLSLVVVLLMDRWVFMRLPPVRRWLGMEVREVLPC